MLFYDMINLRMERSLLARKFFNQKVKNTQKTVMQISIIVVCVIGIIACFCIANYFNNKPKENAVISLRDTVTIEVNSNLPDKTTFFTALENVSEEDIQVSFEKVNTKATGEYDVTIKLYNKKYQAKVLVIDSMAPNLKTKNISIEENTTYQASDFVEQCNDNSMKECTIDFYKLATDQDGNKIDYSTYKDIGVYKIQIVASDASNNTTVQEATLTIGEGKEKPPICKYGSNDYDKSKYVLAIDVTENGCAIDKTIFNNTEDPTQKQIIYQRAIAVMDEEAAKLQSEFKKMNGSGDLLLNRDANAVTNTEGTGIVGYAIHMELTLIKDGVSEVIESYDLDTTGKRIYTINKYNLE